MIEFTSQEGQRLAVNPAAIWHVRPASGSQTAIYAVSGAAIFVIEDYDAVLSKLRSPAVSSSANEA